MSDQGVAIRGVRKSFRSNEVLRGLDLVVPRGAVMSVLGPSGSGKTTLLRIVAGFEHADSGVVEVGGRIVDSGEVFIAPERRAIGYVPQEGNLFPHLNVERNVAFGLGTSSKMARADKRRRVGDLLEMVGLKDLQARYPHQLSGGQQQRVALARAMAVEPKVVLLDEPFSSLDASLRVDVRSEVLQVLRGYQTTVLLVTHDQQEALASADLVAVIRGGVVAQVASPQDLYGLPTDPLVADFLGDANLISGVLKGSGVDTVLGPLPLRTRVEGAVEGDTVQVLVRPEQIRISVANGQGELEGVVVSTEFHGHDRTLTVDAQTPIGPCTLVVRSEGDESFPLGAQVALRVEGTALAWEKSAG